MRINKGQGWVDMGPSSGRGYRPNVSLFDMPSVEDITAKAGCVVCGVETVGGRTFCPFHRKRYRFTPDRFAAERKAA